MSLKNITLLFLLLISILIGNFQSLNIGKVEAEFLSGRSVKLDNPIAGATTNYTISFKISTATTLGSVKIEFCNDTPFFDTA